MSTLGSGSLISPAAAAPAPAVEDASSSWAPHGAALTGFVVGINLLMIVLIFFFFWRFFSGKRGESGSDGADDGDGSLPVASPWASRRRRREAPRARPLDDVASALPVYVYSSAEEGGGKTPECAVCIVELRDGDSARRLPRCGHRFHADCVGAWLRLHATCPLCRATVVAPKAAAAAVEARNSKGGGGDFGTDSPV
ncbi:hypothetical protein SEVIR_3G280000v4 [Setaria viridis]|uniref:RING-type E3 ubiquitin transferase n=1 Tax=Setaria viridis TaxID=4556 RepID=A0A4U6VE47_SETVI|nr:E3 ubiquitin-protein ligase EL5-like [Setaria viridis]TKW27781.1 hypothetical protein SEVIR_3G280000v2 [Setaria viridis]